MIYEYRCNKCEHEFEAKVFMSDKSIVKCPECESESTKLFAATTNVFIPPYFHTMKSDIFNYQDWRNLKKNPNMERAK